MARRNWLARFILGKYAEVLDRADSLVDHDSLNERVRISDAAHKGEHERLSAQIEELKRDIDNVAAEVRATERAMGIKI